MTWLSNLVDQHSEMETPISFWKWAGLVAISAILKDNVYLSRAGAYNLYPNIYVILYADSGLKKGPATNLAKGLVKRVGNTKLITGRSSIQGILKKLGTTSSQPGGHIINKSFGFINSSELSSSLVTDPAALTILTDLYDRNYNEDDWESLLKMEQFNLKDPTITLFGGINAAHAETFFERKDISGGFLARTFIIHETEEGNINSLVRRLSNPPNKDELAKYLKELAKLNGPFKELSDEDNNPTEVGQFYDDWYVKFKTDMKNQGMKDDTGTLNRFGDSVLKVAILLSLSKNPVLEIDLESLKESITLCEKFISGVRKTTFGKLSNEATNTSRKTLIIEELMRRPNHMISREQLNKKYWMQGNANEWDECMQSLDVAGMIKTEVIGNNIVYRMLDKMHEQMKDFMEGKNR